MKKTGRTWMAVLMVPMLLLAHSAAGWAWQAKDMKVRVHLKNGDFVDGYRVAEDKGRLVLDIPYGRATFDHSDVVAVEHLDRVRISVELPSNPTPSETETTPTEDSPASTDSSPDTRKKQPQNTVKPAGEAKKPETDAEWLSALFDASEEDRDSVLEEITKRGEKMLPLLIGELENLGGEKAALAVRALGRIRNPKATLPVSKRLFDPSPEVRTACISTLLLLDAQDSIPQIRALLEDKEPMVRIQALETLSAGFDDEESLKPIARMIGEDNPEIATSAVNAALGLANKHTMMGDLLEVVSELVEGASEASQAQIAKVLGHTKSPEAIPLLLPMIDSPSKDVRAEAIISLGTLKAKEAVEPLLLRLDEEEEQWVMIQIFSTLQLIRDQRVVPKLIEYLRNDEPNIQEASSRALMDLTKKNFGLDAEAWENYWKSVTGQEPE